MSAPVPRLSLVTGGLGFLGSHVVEALLAAGGRVRVLDALIDGLGGRRENVKESERVAVVRADLRGAGVAQRALEGVEAVFHLAGCSGHARSMERPRAHLSLDVDGAAALIASWAALPERPPLVMASTRQVYGRARGPLDENHPVAPRDVDAVAKLAREHLLRVFDVAPARGVALRLTNAYGPRMPLDPERGQVMGVFVRRALSMQRLDVYGGGDDRRSLIYAADVAEAFLAAARTPACMGGVFNVAGSAPIRIRDLAARLSERTGAPVRDVPFPEALRAIDVGDHAVDDARFRELTGWRPRYTLEEGLSATLESFEERES